MCYKHMVFIKLRQVTRYSKSVFTKLGQVIIIRIRKLVFTKLGYVAGNSMSLFIKRVKVTE